MHNKVSLRDKLTGTLVTAEEKIEDAVYDAWHIRLHKKARHHVHKLRKRPDHHKDIIAFSVAFISTCIVFCLWYVISFPKIVESYHVSKKENNALGESSNPLKDITDRLSKDAQDEEAINVQVE